LKEKAKTIKKKCSVFFITSVLAGMIDTRLSVIAAPGYINFLTDLGGRCFRRLIDRTVWKFAQGFFLAADSQIITLICESAAKNIPQGRENKAFVSFAINPYFCACLRRL
jgi:hypothetical protein